MCASSLPEYERNSAIEKRIPQSSTCSVVVITAVSHTAGPQFEPGQVQIAKIYYYESFVMFLK